MKTVLCAIGVGVLLAACSGGTSGSGGGSGGGSAGGGAGGSTGGGSGGGSGGGTAGGGGAGGGTATGGGGGADPLCSSDGGLSRCSCPGFTLCENFEGATLDTSTWTLDSSNGTAVIDNTRSMRGSKSLHINIKSGGGDRALLKETKTFPATGNAFFGRAFVYARSPAPKVHTGLFTALGGNTEVRFGLDHTGVLEPNYMSPPNEYGIFSPLPVTKLPVDQWACLEWEFRGSANEAHFFLNGSELTEIKVLSTFTPPWTAPTYSAFQLGIILFQGDTATATSFDIWFDEVALSATRIGCTK